LQIDKRLQKHSRLTAVGSLP